MENSIHITKKLNKMNRIKRYRPCFTGTAVSGYLLRWRQICRWFG